MFIRTRRRTRLGYWSDSPNRGEVVTYYQAVESYRDQLGRPRQRVLVGWNDWSDGTTIADAIAACERMINAARADAGDWRKFVAECDASYFGPVQYNHQRGHHRNVSERMAIAAERRLARQEARLLALREVDRRRNSVADSVRLRRHAGRSHHRAASVRPGDGWRTGADGRNCVD